MTGKKSFFTVLILVIMLAFSLQGKPAEMSGNSCQDLLTQAMQTLETSCSTVGRNKVCYGNSLVKADARGAAQPKFDAVGDIAAIKDIERIVTSPLAPDRATWGLALLKLQVNLPDSLPGQNVTFIVFGDSSIQNTSGDMKAFYFTSGLGSPACTEAPQDGIVVKSPNHTEVTFNANGVQVTIASTVVLRAQPDQQMQVELVEGHARVTADGISQILKPGEFVSIPLGGSNGLTAVGAPSAPTLIQPEPALTSVLDTATHVEGPTVTLPVNVSIDGCVTDVQGNHITINDYTIDAGNNPTLKSAKVGQCGIHVEGHVKTNAGNAETFELVKAGPQNNGGGNGNGNNGNGNGNGGGNGSNGGGNGNGNNGNGNGNGGGNGSNGGGNGNGNNGNGNGNGGGNGSNGGSNGGGNGNGNNGNGNGNGGGNGSNGGGNGNGNNGNGNGNGGGKK